MSAVQHTPGPWKTSCCDVPANECEPGDDGLRFWSVVCENDGDDFRGNIATVHAAQFLDHGKGISVAERDANARLISAAPELLDALRLVERGMRQWSIAEHAPQWKAIYAAIAKAEGRP